MTLEERVLAYVLALNTFAVEADLTAPELVKLAFFVDTLVEKSISSDPRLLDLTAEAIFHRNPWGARNHKIQYIKDVRQATGCGLKDAKDACERAIAKLDPPF